MFNKVRGRKSALHTFPADTDGSAVSPLAAEHPVEVRHRSRQAPAQQITDRFAEKVLLEKVAIPAISSAIKSSAGMIVRSPFRFACPIQMEIPI